VSWAFDISASVVVAALAVVVVEAFLTGALVAFAQVSTEGVVGTRISVALVFVTRSVATIVTVFLAIGADTLTLVSVVIPAVVALWIGLDSWNVGCWSSVALEHAVELTEHAVPFRADAIGRTISALGVDDRLDTLEQWLVAAPFGVMALDLDGSVATALAAESIVVALELVHAVGECGVDRHSFLWIGCIVLDSVERGVRRLDVLPAAESTASSRKARKELEVEVKAERELDALAVLHDHVDLGRIERGTVEHRRVVCGVS